MKRVIIWRFVCHCAHRTRDIPVVRAEDGVFSRGHVIVLVVGAERLVDEARVDVTRIEQGLKPSLLPQVLEVEEALVLLNTARLELLHHFGIDFVLED